MVADQPALCAEYLIRTCGVRVRFTAGLEADLNKADAEARVIQAVRDVAPQPLKPEPPKPPPGPTSLTVTTNPTDGLRYVYIPSGRFRMGCSPGDIECYDDESQRTMYASQRASGWDKPK
jgi:hypothetical protein